jgi:hypothetical protein
MLSKLVQRVTSTLDDNDTPETLKALQVSMFQPVAYFRGESFSIARISQLTFDRPLTTPVASILHAFAQGSPQFY